MINRGCDKEFAENLIKWAGVIRKTFLDGVDEVITTRRLVHIVSAYQIFGDKLTAITNCVNRFDEDTKQSLDLYTKVDAGEDSEYTNDNVTLLELIEVSRRGVPRGTPTLRALTLNTMLVIRFRLSM